MLCPIPKLFVHTYPSHVCFCFLTVFTVHIGQASVSIKKMLTTKSTCYSTFCLSIYNNQIQEIYVSNFRKVMSENTTSETKTLLEFKSMTQ